MAAITRVDLRQAGDPRQGVGAVLYLGAHTGVPEHAGKLLRCRRAAHHRIRRLKLPALCSKGVHLTMPGQCHHLKAVRMARYHVQRAGTDRTGGAEYGQLHGRTKYRISAANGRVEVRASMRSSTPP
jgi:hypothetical protein